MATHPALNKIQRDVLWTVRWEPRVERWNHTSLNYLRALGLVQSERVTGAKYRWSITELGVATHYAKAGTPVSGNLAEMTAAKR